MSIAEKAAMYGVQTVSPEVLFDQLKPQQFVQDADVHGIAQMHESDLLIQSAQSSQHSKEQLVTGFYDNFKG